MVNELRTMLHEASSTPPQDDTDMRAVLGAGRRRVRVRRAGIVGGTALAAGAIALTSVSWLNHGPPDLAAAGVPRAAGPVIDLTSASAALEGEDYRELTAYTNDDLDSDNGQYFDGVTDDGLILFRDGPRSGQPSPRYSLMDPETGEKDWLPGLDTGQDQLTAVELGRDRLVLIGLSEAVAHVFDRGTREWKEIHWPDLPGSDWGRRLPVLGPDGRLYVLTPGTQGSPPPGGWPTGPGGEADDSGAVGNTYDLWSVSLTDPSDTQSEGLRVGAVGFGDDSMVWTDSENSSARIHVRDLVTGKQTSFDPELGDRCNLLGFDVAGGRIAMTQYCGTYGGGVRDDRVQVVTTDGEQVVTIQDSGVDGGNLVGGGDYLQLLAYGPATGGTYVFDFDEGRLEQVSSDHSSWTVGTGPTPGSTFMWTTPTGKDLGVFGPKGATVHLGELLGG